MKLSEEIKALITKEYNEFKDYMYANSPKEIRDQLGQFFTPATVSLIMLEQYNYESLSGRIMFDPTCGSGNLLAACLIAGADSDKLFGNDYDARMVRACRERLNRVCDMLGKPHINDWQIHRGNATDSFCLTQFGPEYKQKLREHYQDINSNGSYNLFNEPELTAEQEEFLKEVD